MYPILLPLFGPLALHGYGFFIALGVATFVFCVQRDAKCIRLGMNKRITSIIYIGFLGAFFGGKILYYYTEQSQMHWLHAILPWNGGFSILGSIIGGLSTLLLYFSRTQNALLANFDCIAPYVPLLQSFGRIGCFFAGCCYGKPCDITVSVQGTSQVPLIAFHIYQHPVQLYSALFLFCIFFYLFKRKDNENVPDGQITVQYLMLTSFERFVIDYWRGDKTFTRFGSTLSDNQCLAIAIFLLSFFSYIFTYFYYKKQLRPLVQPPVP